MGDYARALFHKITRRDMEWLSLYEEMANYLMKTKKPLLAAKDLLLLPEELFSEKLHPLHRELYDAIALLAVNKETLQIRLDLLTLHCDTSYAAPCRSLAKEIASSKLPPLLQKLWEFVEKRVLEEGLFAEDPLTKGCCINNALSYILATKEKRGKDFFSDRKKYAALYDINLPEREAIEIYQTLTKALFAEIKIPLSEDDCMTIEKLLQWKEELQKKCDKEKSLLEKISPQQQLPYWHYLDITMTNKAEKTALFTFSVEKTTPLFYALIEQLPDSTYKDIEKIMELFLDTAITLAEVAPASVDIKIILDALLKKKIPSAEEKAMVLLMMLTDGMKGEYILPKEALTSFKELLLRATRGDSISNLTLLLESRNLEPALPKGVYEPFIHEFFVELFAQCSPKDKSSKDFTRRCLTLYCYVDSPFHKSPPTEKTRAQFFALIAELMKNNSIRTSTFAIVSLYHKLLIDKCYGEESLETKENGDSSPAEHLTVKREEGLNKAVSKVTGRPSSSDEKLASQLSPLFPQNLPARQEGEAGKLFDENYHKSLLLLAKSSIESEAHNEIEALLSIKFSHKVLSHAIDHYRDKCRELDTAEAFLLFFQSQKALISEETLKKQVVAIRDLMMKLVENDSDYFKIYPLHALYAYARIDPEKCASFKEEPFYRKEMISIANALLCHPSPLALTRLLDILKHDDKELFPTLTKGKMVFFSNLMKSLEKIPLLYDNSTPFVFIKKILFEKDINKQNKGNFYEKKLMLQLLTSSLNCCTTLAKEKKYPSLLKVHLEKLIPIFTKALLQELFYSEESFSRLLTVWRDVHITYLTETADSSTVQSSIKMIAILFQRDIMEGSCSYQKIVAREIRNILLVLRELEQRSKVLSLSELRTFFSQENITIDKYETIAFKKLLSLPATGKVIHFSSDQ